MVIEALAPFALIVVFATPWVLLVGRRFGHVIGAVAVLAVAPLVVLCSFHVSRLVGADPVWCSLGASAVIGAAGLVLIARSRTRHLAPGRAALATWLPATAGLLAWLGTLAIAPLVSGSVRGWAMNGDGANNIRITREMLDNHGHILSSLQSVPLQNELLAIAAWWGRGGDASQLLAHDLTALATFEAMAIGLTGLLLGVVATSLLPPTRLLRIVVVGAITSLTCVTWFVTGLPLESGYLNVHVVLPFVLAAWLAFVQARRHPVVAGILLACLTVVVVLSWAPLAVVPAGLGIALLVRHRSSLVRGRRAIAVAVVGALLMLAAVIAAPTFAGILSTSGLLAMPGHGFPSTLALFALGAVGSIVAAVVATRRGLVDLRAGVVALCLAAGIAIAVLQAINANAIDPSLAYYPAKHTWVVTVLALAVLLSLIVRLADQLTPRVGTAVSVGAVVLAIVAATLGPAPLRPTFSIQQPLALVITDSARIDGEHTVDTIIEYAGTPGLVMQWDSGSPDEAFINFWALEFRGAAATDYNGTARYFTTTGYRTLRDTGAYSPPPLQTLCAVVTSLGGSATVHTRNAGLENDLESTCPEVGIDVVVDAPRQ